MYRSIIYRVRKAVATVARRSRTQSYNVGKEEIIVSLSLLLKKKTKNKTKAIPPQNGTHIAAFTPCGLLAIIIFARALIIKTERIFTPISGSRRVDRENRIPGIKEKTKFRSHCQILRQTPYKKKISVKTCFVLFA